MLSESLSLMIRGDRKWTWSYVQVNSNETSKRIKQSARYTHNSLQQQQQQQRQQQQRKRGETTHTHTRTHTITWNSYIYSCTLHTARFGVSVKTCVWWVVAVSQCNEHPPPDSVGTTLSNAMLTATPNPKQPPESPEKSRELRPSLELTPLWYHRTHETLPLHATDNKLQASAIWRSLVKTLATPSDDGNARKSKLTIKKQIIKK